MRSKAQPRTLAQFAVDISEHIPAAGNLPASLDDPGMAWFVERGAIDVFIVETRDGQVTSSLSNVMRLASGRLAFGVAPHLDETSFHLIAKGLADTRLRRIPIPALLDEISRNDRLAVAVADQADAWVANFGTAAASNFGMRAPVLMQLVPGLATEVQGVLAAKTGTIWVPCKNLDATFLGIEEPDQDVHVLVPVTQDTWITIPRPAMITCMTSREIDPGTLLLDLLPPYHRLIIRTQAVNRRLLLVDDANLQMARSKSRRHEMIGARRSLASLLERTPVTTESGDDALIAALKEIGRHEGIEIRLPPQDANGRAPGLLDILDRSEVRARRVRLSAETRWWRSDSGAMLAFRRDGNGPVVLHPGGIGGYRLWDPATGEEARAGPHTAERLHEHAWLLYRTIQEGGPADFRDALRTASNNLTSDLTRLTVAGIGAGSLALAPAVAVGILVDDIIPSGVGRAIALFATAMAAIGFVACLAHVFRGTALMRIEGRVATRLGVVLWDRLLHLPPRFFRQHTGGGLAMRAMTFHFLRELIAGPAAGALVSIVFLLPALLMLFLYNATLAVVTMGIGVAAILVAVVCAVLQIGPQRRFHEASRELAAILLQIINGVGKLRSTGAEGSAFAFWAQQFRKQQAAQIRISRYNEHLMALSAALPAFAGAALFAVALQQGPENLSLAEFLAVYTASVVFYALISTLSLSFEAIAAIIPGCEQVRPILQAIPEAAPQAARPIVLAGDIRFDHVDFRYSEDGPLILHDISIHAKPGEFIAIVSESGGGKSTLIRLALGLEHPTAGAIYFDGNNLDSLSAQSVRRQVGVVVQDGALNPGTILNNIIGVMDDLTIEDAWRAARIASVDRDIAEMPMGMYSTVGESAAVFSGGQGQRMRIAAALVRNPRIIFLDEATSWLDETSQNQTMSGIERLTSTRIVIAHRLSTIREANRIYVLEGGCVVQTGRFEELLLADGPFRKLAERQIL